jgi:predicted site-specific integrase-resolvase
MPPEEILVSQAAAARRFGVSVATWRRWVRAGRAPQPVNLPGHPKFLASDLDAFARQLVGIRARRFFPHARRMA